MESGSDLESGVIFNVLFFLYLCYGKTIRLPNLFVYKFEVFVYEFGFWVVWVFSIFFFFLLLN